MKKKEFREHRHNYKRQKFVRDQRKYVYKYMDLEVAILSLQNKILRFVEPTCWLDKSEAYYYSADYSNVGNVQIPKVYATCFTLSPNSEAAWKLYTYNKRGLGAKCVQFVINIDKLRNELSDSNGCFYESDITYVDAVEFQDLWRKKSPHYSCFFDNFDVNSFLSLLLLKRNDFKHENERRILYVPAVENGLRSVSPGKGRPSKGSFVDLVVHWNRIVSEVKIDASCSDLEFSLFQKVCKDTLPNVTVKKFSPYSSYRKITIES